MLLRDFAVSFITYYQTHKLDKILIVTSLNIDKVWLCPLTYIVFLPLSDVTLIYVVIFFTVYYGVAVRVLV